MVRIVLIEIKSKSFLASLPKTHHASSVDSSRPNACDLRASARHRTPEGQMGPRPGMALPVVKQASRFAPAGHSVGRAHVIYDNLYKELLLPADVLHPQ